MTCPARELNLLVIHIARRMRFSYTRRLKDDMMSKHRMKKQIELCLFWFRFQ